MPWSWIGLNDSLSAVFIHMLNDRRMLKQKGADDSTVVRIGRIEGFIKYFE